MRFTLPCGACGQCWSRVLDTGDQLPRFYWAGAQVPVQDRSLAVLKKVS